MTELELQEYHEHAFDAFCKRVIRNASVDALRASRRKQKTEMDIDDPIQSELAMKIMVKYDLNKKPTKRCPPQNTGSSNIDMTG